MHFAWLVWATRRERVLLNAIKTTLKPYASTRSPSVWDAMHNQVLSKTPNIANMLRPVGGTSEISYSPRPDDWDHDQTQQTYYVLRRHRVSGVRISWIVIKDRFGYCSRTCIWKVSKEASKWVQWWLQAVWGGLKVVWRALNGKTRRWRSAIQNLLGAS